jgi:hypothetical protein
MPYSCDCRTCLFSAMLLLLLLLLLLPLADQGSPVTWPRGM